jgi:hypothetical protein
MIVVAFPGGGGGHFIAHVVNALITQQLNDTNAGVNFHGKANCCQKFLNFSFLDTKMNSYEEELCYINSIYPQSKLIIGHFRNIDEIYRIHKCLIIVVEISDTDHDLLVARVLQEAINLNFTKIKYQDIRGEDWPDINPGLDQLPRWIKLEIESQLHKMFHFWNSQVICNDIPVLKITTHDIFYGHVIEKITNYLKVPQVQGLQTLHENYKLLVTQKYLKNISCS